jgi:cytochrome c553
MKQSICLWLVMIAMGLLRPGPAAFAQSTTQNLVNPAAIPLRLTAPNLTVPPWPPRSSTITNPPAPAIVPGQAPRIIPATPPHFVPPAPQPGATGPLPPNVLVWDSELKEATVKSGEPAAQFVFNFTNVSSGDVAINHVQTSCGCTVAQLPSLPWKIAAGTNAQIPVTMNLAGKGGVTFKTVTVNTDKGWKMLTVKATILPPAATAMTMDERKRNQELVKADRQAVFKGDCARCHVEPAIGKMSKDLFAAACGVCHEAEHRATMVPDLHALPHETNAEFWKVWIAHGKVGSLMPAFAQTDGGPLSDQQIASLVDYLVKAIPSKPGAPPAALPPTAAVH